MANGSASASETCQYNGSDRLRGDTFNAESGIQTTVYSGERRKVTAMKLSRKTTQFKQCEYETLFLILNLAADRSQVAKTYQSGIIVAQFVHSALLPRESLGECLETAKYKLKQTKTEAFF